MPTETQQIGTAPDLAPWVNRIRPRLEAAAQAVVTVGRDLIEAKDALPHGRWLPLLNELGLSARTRPPIHTSGPTPGYHKPVSGDRFAGIGDRARRPGPPRCGGVNPGGQGPRGHPFDNQGPGCAPSRTSSTGTRQSRRAPARQRVGASAG